MGQSWETGELLKLNYDCSTLSAMHSLDILPWGISVNLYHKSAILWLPLCNSCQPTKKTTGCEILLYVVLAMKNFIFTILSFPLNFKVAVKRYFIFLSDCIYRMRLQINAVTATMQSKSTDWFLYEATLAFNWFMQRIFKNTVLEDLGEWTFQNFGSMHPTNVGAPWQPPQFLWITL